RVWTSVLAMSVALCAVSFARGDDDSSAKSSGNWFTRLFRRQPTTTKGEPAKGELAKGEQATRANGQSYGQAESPTALRARAQMELMRRQDVCDKMREIAFQTNDEELRRKADQLDQRAWDAYVQKTSRAAGSRTALTADEQAIESRLMGAG